MIGGGSGGLSFAAGAAQMGASVILIEHNKMGGDCLNTGCVPSKALIAAAKKGHEMAVAKYFGWKTSKTKPSVDFKKVMQHVRHVIQSIAPHDSVERFTALGVEVIQDHAQFFSPQIVETKDFFIRAKRFIIATGSQPFVPPIPGLKGLPYLTNETVFRLKELPQHLVLIGGGPIGMELAQAFRRLGSKVTVLEAFAALPKDDPEATTCLKEKLVEEGVSLHEHVSINHVKNPHGNFMMTYTQDKKVKKIQASHVLVATGRRPNTQKLSLEKAGIEVSERGEIIVDPTLKTTNPRVYAIGDCIGGYQFTHVAGYHASLAIGNSIFRRRSKVQTRAIPWVTYTDPELAHVGLSEPQLKKMKKPYKVLKMPFKENDRALTDRQVVGFIKVLVSPKGAIYGATILGSHAGELIYPWVMAIQNKLKISAMVKSIAPYPTLSDLTKRVAGSYYTPKIFSDWMKRIVHFIMRLT
ncbi:FAD-dependent oxidoreductase [Alphaproteobacteria bacterium]|nr:FAD-dependent oxidoreductase [Alphaproteobacteria bacterium]